MIYWAGNAIDTSIRTYANNNRYPWTPSHDRWPVIEAPTGITFVGYENPRGGTTSEQRVPNFLDSDRAAGTTTSTSPLTTRRALHPVEIPTEWVEDLRRTFRGRR